jgi:hypothetical protein
MTNLDIESINAKFCVGPTSFNPGPMLFIADATLLKIPSKDRLIQEILDVVLKANVPRTNIATYKIKKV